jgi:hypothetical protein
VSLSIPWLVRPDGTVGRGAYAAVGLVLFALKHNIDRLVASAVFDRPWSIFNYATLVALALPFIAVGVVLTLGRLREAGWPAGLVLLFFAPVLNLAFFLLVSVGPPRRPAAADATQSTLLARIIPERALGSATLAVAVMVVFGPGAVRLSVTTFGNTAGGSSSAFPSRSVSPPPSCTVTIARARTGLRGRGVDIGDPARSGAARLRLRRFVAVSDSMVRCAVSSPLPTRGALPSRGRSFEIGSV